MEDKRFFQVVYNAGAILIALHKNVNDFLI